MRRVLFCPQSLLWRTFWLIVLLVGLSLYAWFEIYVQYAARSNIQQSAQMVVSVVNLTRSALLVADSSQRRAWLQELKSLEGISLYPAEQSDPVVPLDDKKLMQIFQHELRARLGQHTRISSELNGRRGFFVSFRLEANEPENEYWVMLPQERVLYTNAAGWINWAIAAGLMSLMGAYLLVLSITRPLKALEQSARKVGRGELPSPLPERGSSELVELSKAFNQMSQDLAQLESDRALILAGISHDLRTPLARLRLGVEMSGSTPEDIDAMSVDIEEMDRIINQFLDFARNAQESGTPKETNLAEMLNEITSAYQRRGCAVTLDIQSALKTKTYPHSLRRAVTNLIDNALRYAGADLPIDITLKKQSNLAVIDVADRGPGIPLDQVERLKRPFTQLEAARTDVVGSGLGLAIVDRIVRMHGGRFDLLAREGGGLLARLQLPL